MAAPSRMQSSGNRGGALLLVVQRDNADTDELRARNAFQKQLRRLETEESAANSWNARWQSAVRRIARLF